MKRPAPGEITRKTRIRIQSITVIVVSFFVSSRESRQGDRSKEQDASTYMSCNFSTRSRLEEKYTCRRKKNEVAQKSDG